MHVNALALAWPGWCERWKLSPHRLLGRIDWKWRHDRNLYDHLSVLPRLCVCGIWQIKIPNVPLNFGFCLPGVSWLLCGTSLRCHAFVCSLWLLYFLIILAYYFSGKLSQELCICFLMFISQHLSLLLPCIYDTVPQWFKGMEHWLRFSKGEGGDLFQNVPPK